ncbi:hypothetical protein [Saccharopolyspora griseoalba]|uniref:Glycosyltransferase RgtA/B/C/D-like domain-containing protein n=1 Tax=Saccharopolyspora griseoalba TaxID=1431848 RepID=A0ABW2LMU4_9PSEU
MRAAAGEALSASSRNTAAGARQRTNRPAWTAAATAAVLAAALFWLVHDALTDDAYITLGYARGVALHGHWGMIPDETANSATSPGNVLLLAALTLALRSPVLALGALFVASAVVLVLALRRGALDRGMPGWTGTLTAALVGVNPLLLSTVGLEMTLAAALLATLLAAVTGGRPWLFGLAVGALALTRLDLGVFVIAVLLGCPRMWLGWWKWLTTALLVCAPWFAFSWFRFGSAIPDTLVIKQLQESWGRYGFGNGPGKYYDMAPLPTALAALPAACGVVALLALIGCAVARRGSRAWPWAVLGLGGVAHYSLYAQLDVPPYHWYYAPSLMGVTLALGGALGLVATGVRWRVPVAALGAILLVPQVGLALAQGTPWRTAPIQTNWASPADYARIGAEIGERVGDATVASPGEIGTLAYFCECHIVDGFSDRGYLAAGIDERLRRAGPLAATLLRWNYHHFAPTEPRRIDYVLTAEPGPGPDPFWTISTPLSPPGHLVLAPAER